MPDPVRLVAFAGTARLAAGPPGEVARAVRDYLDRTGPSDPPVFVLDAVTSASVDLALDGTPDAVAELAERQFATRAEHARRLAARTSPTTAQTREAKLLARHWQWLDAQPGGASAALRRLVEDARRRDDPAASRRRAQDAVHRFLYAVAGDLPGFEEVARALYADDRVQLETLLDAWPTDVVAHARTLLDGDRAGAEGIDPAENSERLSCDDRPR
jgi:hypothetical protein